MATAVDTSAGGNLRFRQRARRLGVDPVDIADEDDNERETSPHPAPSSEQSAGTSTYAPMPLRLKPRRREHSPDPALETSWFDVPLAFALVPAVGSLLTGSDLLKDFLHLAFLLYYLHNLIKVPWTLYVAARARRTNPPAGAQIDDHIRALARSELRLAELTYLIFTIIAPFLGAVLLRSVSKLLSIDTVSTFSTSLFVLATGMRPWRHLVDLLRRRAEALHDVVHLPADDSLHTRLELLEGELSHLRSELASKTTDESLLESTNLSLKVARQEIKKLERQAELNKASYDSKLAKMEAAIEALQMGGSSGGMANRKGAAANGQQYPAYLVVEKGGDRNARVTTTTGLIPHPIFALILNLVQWMATVIFHHPANDATHTAQPWRVEKRVNAELVELDEEDEGVDAALNIHNI